MLCKHHIESSLDDLFDLRIKGASTAGEIDLRALLGERVTLALPGEPMRSHEAATGGEDEALRAVVHSRIHDVLSGLPERPREAIVRRYLEEQELPDVAQSMGVSVSTVRRDCEEWLPRLGRRLGKAGVDDR